ncbi:MAG: DUF1343 domain-containing protein [Chthonomonadaceae bacterium]|nr:DUF1343 domain-containing protein [Chthonomonadaceae bacterium]
MAWTPVLDRWIDEGFAALEGQRIGLVCNQATVDTRFQHILDAILVPHREGHLHVQVVFGPQHGLWGFQQDNMIEWEGGVDPRTGLVVHSLYGEHREPTPAMLEGIERLVVDLPDIGSRYYTFMWTLALCMKACAPLGIPVTVLDRPNPLGGRREGPVLDPAFDSFVGLLPLPTRHGWTLGELATHFQRAHFPACELHVVRCEGWNRADHLDETPLPWVVPSPNMPTLETAMVYPGMCLLEGTQLSEGRGTTRPFEIFGAPFIDAWAFCDSANALGLPGCWFRPYVFEPTFHKFAGQTCGGAFLHVTDRATFEPVLTAIAALQVIVQRWGDAFEWRPAPYEYEFEKRPIDILAGNSWVREAIEGNTPIPAVRERMADELAAFDRRYPDPRLY